MFYPDIHHGEHKCDTRLGPCPGPKPDDYLMVRRGKKGDRKAVVIIVTHYINHGNTWQSAQKTAFETNWIKVGDDGHWDYLVVKESELVDLDKNTDRYLRR